MSNTETPRFVLVKHCFKCRLNVPWRYCKIHDTGACNLHPFAAENCPECGGKFQLVLAAPHGRNDVKIVGHPKPQNMTKEVVAVA